MQDPPTLGLTLASYPPHQLQPVSLPPNSHSNVPASAPVLPNDVTLIEVEERDRDTEAAEKVREDLVAAVDAQFPLQRPGSSDGPTQPPQQSP